MFYLETDSYHYLTIQNSTYTTAPSIFDSNYFLLNF